ncbi:ArsR/SmtB family transcription factor [Amycolatopsis kentuckyensis]|uniref:ArsR/SmtB family transcription factor n=1 Tax=Amycolatopsis kentuckyensis TaxID=218823 RepID=UPI003561F652
MSAPHRDTAKTYAEWFRALADPTRVQILNLLAEAGTPMAVGAIGEQVSVGQFTVSAHLRVLADTGFVPVGLQGAARL